MKQFLDILCALACLSIAACAPSAKRLDKLSLGMTKAEAIKAIGKPKSTTADSRGEVLAYDFTDKPFGDGMIFPGRYFVIVQNDKVTGWQRDDHKDAVDRQRAYQMNTAGLGGGMAAPGIGGGGTESVLLVKHLDTANKVIVRRRNGDSYILDYGIGALSMGRYEGRQILINSPGLFAGIGSSIILPGEGQTAKIWAQSPL
jgi:hypothetical protein